MALMQPKSCHLGFEGSSYIGPVIWVFCGPTPDFPDYLGIEPFFKEVENREIYTPVRVMVFV